MSTLAAIRPDEWNLPFFFHVLGAFTLVGALVTAAAFLVASRRDGSLALTRLGFRSLLLVALPAFLVMRIAAQWLASEEGVDDSEDAWITIGYAATDVGVLLLIAATVAAGLGVRRARRADAGGRSRGGTVAAWLVMLLIVIYAVTIWAMATKPA